MNFFRSTAQTTPSAQPVSSESVTPPTDRPPAGPPRRRVQPVTLSVLACLAIVAGFGLAATGQGELSRRAEIGPGLARLLGGGLIVAIGLAASARQLPFLWLPAWPGARPSRPRGRFDPWPGRCLAVGFGLGIGAAGVWIAGRFSSPTSATGALLWLGSCLLVTATLIGVDWAVNRPPATEPGATEAADRPSTGSRAAVWLLPLGVFAVALAVRLYQIETVPFGIWFDEAESGLEGRRLLAGRPYEPLSHDFGRDPSAYFYLIAASFAVFGEGIVALRLIPAAIGALGAAAVTAFGREVFGWRIGLVAGLLLAIARWPVDFSRFAMINVTAPLLAALVFWLLARAIRRDHWSGFGLAGLALGLGAHGYAGFRPIFGAMIVALVAGAILRRWGPRQILGRSAIWLAGVLIVGLPVIIFAAQYPEEYNKRAGETFLLAGKTTTEERVQAIVDNTRAHLLMFNYQGDRNGRHNLPGEPMLDPVSGVLLVVGLLWSLGHLIAWRYLVVLTWSAAALAGGVLSLDWEAPQAARTIAITPALALLAAIGLVLPLDRLVAGSRAFAGRVRALAPVLIGGGRGLAWLAAVSIVGGIAWLNLDTYFTQQMSTRTSWLEFSPRETILAKEARRQAADFPVILTTHTLLNHPAIRFLAPDLQPIVPFDPVGDLPLRRNEGTLVFLDDRDRALWEEVARYYPAAPVLRFSPPLEREPILAEFAVSREQIEARRGLEGVYGSPAGARIARTDPTIDFDWNHGAPVGIPFTAGWSGSLVVPETGEYAFVIPRGFTLAIDDRAYPAGSWPAGLRVRLARGNHRFTLSGAVTEPRDVRLLWRGPGRPEFAPIPNELLFNGLSGGTGLLGSFYPNPNWQGAPAIERIDPVLAIYFHLLPLGRPYSVEWRGYLEAPRAGDYLIGVEQVSTSQIWIDDRLILTNDRLNDFRETRVRLTAGRHPIRIRYQDMHGASHIYLSWAPPGEPLQPIAGKFLYPAEPAEIR